MINKTYETGFETGVILERIRVKTELIKVIHTLPDGNFAKAILQHFSIKLDAPITPEYEEEQEL
jgi:hypothetical protein